MEDVCARAFEGAWPQHWSTWICVWGVGLRAIGIWCIVPPTTTKRGSPPVLVLGGASKVYKPMLCSADVGAVLARARKQAPQPPQAKWAALVVAQAAHTTTQSGGTAELTATTHIATTATSQHIAKAIKPQHYRQSPHTQPPPHHIFQHYYATQLA
jgi:hypothetical protein